MVHMKSMGNRPSPLKSFVLNNYKIYNFNFNIKGINDSEWEFDSIEIPQNKLNYGDMVDIIISSKYPADKMQAIINNYLLDSEDINIKKEFNDMQNYRKDIKSQVKSALNSLKGENI